MMRKILQIAFAALITDGTIERMIRQDELEDGFVGVIDDGRGRSHDHPVGHRRTAGSLQFRHLLDQVLFLAAIPSSKFPEHIHEYRLSSNCIETHYRRECPLDKDTYAMPNRY